MTLFGTKPPDPQKAFEARIKRFLEANGASGAHFWNKGDSLEALFDLVRQTQEDLSEAHSRIRKNQDAHDIAIHELKGYIRNRDSKIRLLEASHEKAIHKICRENEEVIEAMDQTHVTDMENMKTKRDTAEASMRSKHEEERNRLVSQLLVNVDESHEWPDDKIKERFSELHRLIDSTASSRREELKFPSDGDISKDVDPIGFFQKANPRGRGHFLIKSVLWEIIREQFFWLPFGLGAFGRGGAHQSILKALNDWKALSLGDRACTEDSDLLIFEADSLSNRWRSLTFQCIQSNQGNEHLGFHNTIPQQRAENVAESNARIIGYLSRVAALSDNTLSKEVEREVERVIGLAEEIALQFGIHSCKFIWVKPDPAWNWDPAPGLVKCVQKSGGETSQRIIVKCEGKSEG